MVIRYFIRDEVLQVYVYVFVDLNFRYSVSELNSFLHILTCKITEQCSQSLGRYRGNKICLKKCW